MTAWLISTLSQLVIPVAFATQLQYKALFAQEWFLAVNRLTLQCGTCDLSYRQLPENWQVAGWWMRDILQITSVAYGCRPVAWQWALQVGVQALELVVAQVAYIHIPLLCIHRWSAPLMVCSSVWHWPQRSQGPFMECNCDQHVVVLCVEISDWDEMLGPQGRKRYLWCLLDVAVAVRKLEYMLWMRPNQAAASMAIGLIKQPCMPWMSWRRVTTIMSCYGIRSGLGLDTQAKRPPAPHSAGVE